MLISGFAGTLESNDIYIVVEELPLERGVEIELESIVFAQYGKSIEKTIKDVVYSTARPCGLYVKANDKGALPCTIEARVKTALSRAGLLKGDV